jgi:hypothetical protein
MDFVPPVMPGPKSTYTPVRKTDATSPDLPQYTPPWGYINCLGESTRPLSSTFAGDELEFRKLGRFFSV